MEYYSVKDVAKLLDYHPVTISRLAREGKIESIRISNRHYFTIDSVMEFIRKCNENK